MNFSLKINLLKFKNATVVNLKGNQSTKRCVVIPIDDNESIFLGEKGCYLSLLGIELNSPKYEDTHCIKPNLPPSIREQLTEEQRMEIPIVGNMHPLQPKEMEIKETVETDEDLPF